MPTTTPIRWPIGTFINMGTVTLGSLLGLALQQAFPADVQAIIFQAIGLGTLVLGMMMCFKLPQGWMLFFLFSLILGGIIGQLLHIDVALRTGGDWLKEHLALGEGRFTEGLVTAFLLFCIGSMTIVGAVEEGLHNKRELLLVKSLLDGITSIAFAATYGIGVLFSILPMLIFQGGITVLAAKLERLFTPKLIDLLSAVGGALIIGIGINLLELRRVNVENLLPALLIAIGLAWARERYEQQRDSPRATPESTT